jgi:DNA replication protein DnaC
MMSPMSRRLVHLHLSGMKAALEAQNQSKICTDMAFNDRFDALVTAEEDARKRTRVARLLKEAKFKYFADPLDFRAAEGRGISTALLNELATSGWVRKKQNMILSGPVGVGKSWLACALGRAAAQDCLSVRYIRLPTLFEEMTIANATGTLLKLQDRFAKFDLLILDEFGSGLPSSKNITDLLEIIERRIKERSTMFAGQLPHDSWHAYIRDPQAADSIVDRALDEAVVIQLAGESQRRPAKEYIIEG